MTADSIDGIIRAAIQTEIERLREKAAEITVQVLRGFLESLGIPARNDPGNLANTGKTSEFYAPVLVARAAATKTGAQQDFALPAGVAQTAATRTVVEQNNATQTVAGQTGAKQNAADHAATYKTTKTGTVQNKAVQPGAVQSGAVESGSVQTEKTTAAEITESQSRAGQDRVIETVGIRAAIISALTGTMAAPADLTVLLPDFAKIGIGGGGTEKSVEGTEKPVEKYVRDFTGRIIYGLEKSVEAFADTRKSSSPAIFGYNYGITNNSYPTVTPVSPAVNIYMTESQTAEKTAETIRKRLLEFTQNPFGTDDFFSRTRPR